MITLSGFNCKSKDEKIFAAHRLRNTGPEDVALKYALKVQNAGQAFFAVVEVVAVVVVVAVADVVLLQ